MGRDLHDWKGRPLLDDDRKAERRGAMPRWAVWVVRRRATKEEKLR